MKKSDKTASSSSWDSLKWILVVALVIAGVWANYYYSDIDWPIRLAGWIILACVALAIASQTAGGRRVWAFSKDARNELRKVVWPTRQETVQTTMIIVGMVVIMALILWGIDSALLAIVSRLTG
ncbi:MAG TPA: preprotein translocase subunit SecE [Gammaproteobacteria bacterium]|nr:preprotein translocase subunit SecE [Gammaproteobacteria bacterium]